jgi:hypothetical protein
MKRTIMLAALLLAGCGGPAPVRVETVRVMVPQPVPCIAADLPVVPGLPELTGQAEADTRLLAARLLLVRAVALEILATAEPCRVR